MNSGRRDWEWIPRRGEAVFAVQMEDDAMAPVLPEGVTAYVEDRPVGPGEVGVFLLDGEALCRQYYRDPLGMGYLFVLNRRRAGLDRLVPPKAQRELICLGRVTVPAQPLPGKQ